MRKSRFGNDPIAAAADSFAGAGPEQSPCEPRAAMARGASAARRVRYGLLLLLACAFTFRLYRLDAPLTDHRAMRQAHTAAMARSCYRNGLNPLNARPDALNFGRSNFSLYPWLVALGYKPLGGVHEWVGRLLSAIFSVATVYLVYCIGRCYWDTPTALAAGAYFAFSPAGIFFGRALMPETLMMLLMCCAFYSATRWSKGGSVGWIACSAVCVGLSILVKLTPLILGLAIAWLLYERGGARALFGPPGWVFAACAIAPIIWWYTPYLARLAASAGRDWRPGLTTPHFYAQMLVNRPGGVLLGPLGYLAALVGLFSGPGSRRGWAVHLWVVAGGLYILAAPKVNFALEYYNLPLLPAACLLAGRGTLLLVRDTSSFVSKAKRLSPWLWWMAASGYVVALALGYFAKRNWEKHYVLPSNRDLLSWAMLTLAVCIPVSAVLRALHSVLASRGFRHGRSVLWAAGIALTGINLFCQLALMYRQRPYLLEAAQALAQVSRAEDKVIEATDKCFTILYYADRRGWYRFRKNFTPEQIEELRARGAAWLVTTLLDQLESDAELKRYLSSLGGPVAKGPRFRIYDLRRRGAAPPENRKDA